MQCAPSPRFHSSTDMHVHHHNREIINIMATTHIANFADNTSTVVQGKLPADWFIAAPSTTVFTTLSYSRTPLSTVHPAVRIML